MTYKICYWDNDAKEQRERDATLTEVAEIDARRAAAAIPQVPQQVTMRQARLALLQAGLYATVNSTIANLTGDVGDAARIEWEYSQTVQRRYPLIETLSSVLSLSDEQLDALFIQAVQL